ncbi:hypothetical protein AOCH_005946 [Aspergillus ochraceoroseus]|uniref:SUN domain-containing protein n=1 Tax=Aspergillus ochraceoroseus TaxID=138278 RepID=A0A0F8X7Y9_9EURO|nr:hypothetical protein AOCH_005946 [Aspergillus ochraceoroseus]
MLAPKWTTTCWIPWAILVSVWVQRTIGEGQQSHHPPPVCLSRHAREVHHGLIQWPMCIETRWERKSTGSTRTFTSLDAKRMTSSDNPSPVTVSVEIAATPPSSRPPRPPERDPEMDADSDSPLDNANFLSFEDWRKQNLAKAGQSAENVGGNRRAGTAGKDRHRPTGINNALDSLGEDAEIELDFGGFGADPSEPATSATSWRTKVLPAGGGGTHLPTDAGRSGGMDASGQGLPHTGGPRSKDAGTTCKERFNYASFDCAATVLKTNPEAKGSSSVLIENKDSYMLNECRARNKFLILELCDDILVDTVVLANYEFFSSIFHTFRVSVADRYPAKPDQWKELGIYEARNTREIQAFAVENPLIWARYLRIEFLTHYGHEFYCPLSLIRVHGTTMLEEYKHDGDAGRVEEEVAHAVEEVQDSSLVDQNTRPLESTEFTTSGLEGANLVPETCPHFGTAIELTLRGLRNPSICYVWEIPAQATGPDASCVSGQPVPSAATTPSSGETSGVVGGSGNGSPHDVRDARSPGSASAQVQASAESSFSTTTVSDAAPHDAPSETDPRSGSGSRDEPGGGAGESMLRATNTQPPSANPTTQESFFKSVNKRLQMLETSSSLSLQYIEEQSRILRDAFNKVEKRQVSKTSTFLETLNVTVLNELKQFRDQYDQVWKSVTLEFEHQRIQYHQEIYSLSAQLGVVADELVFQKRVAVIQSIVVLFCFALMLFTRSAASGYIELPSVQNMVSRSYSLRPSSPLFGSSPPGSPGSTRSSRSTAGHRRELSDDSPGSSMRPAAATTTTYAQAPPTPTSDAGHDTKGVANRWEIPHRARKPRPY